MGAKKKKSNSSIHLRCLKSAFQALIGATKLYYRNQSCSRLLFLTTFHDALLHLSSLSFLYPFNAIWFNKSFTGTTHPHSECAHQFSLLFFISFFIILNHIRHFKHAICKCEGQYSGSYSRWLYHLSLSLCFSSFLFLSLYAHCKPISLTQFPDGYTLKASICYGNALYKVLPSAWHVNSFMTI